MNFPFSMIDSLPEIGRKFQCQLGGGNELPVLDGVNGLAGDTDGLGQLLLRYAQDSPLDTDVILHGGSSIYRPTDSL